VPFKSVRQELYMRINNPKLWRSWVLKYGHAKGYKAKISSMARKKGRGKRSKK